MFTRIRIAFTPRAVLFSLVALAGAGLVDISFSSLGKPWNLGPTLAFADDFKTVMPPEATGFRGTVTGTIAKSPGNDWFIIKVVNVVSYTPGNKTRITPDALTALWKDKYVAVLLIKTMPQLNVGDTVSVTTFQFEAHLRSIDGVAVKQNAVPADPNNSPGPASRPEFKLPDGVKVLRDVEYARVGDRSLTMDIFTPTLTRGKLPVVVWIYGCAWRGAWRRDASLPGMNVVGDLVGRGYAMASITHRLSSEAVFPAQIEDCKAAIRFLRANAAKYSLNANHIGVWGASSGGHLASLLGTSGDVKAVEGTVGDNLGVSSRVQCVVDYFGPSDMNKFKGQPVWPKVDDPKSPLCQLFGGLLADKQDRVAQANPITYITRDCPPFLVAHGDKDNSVPFNQSELLVDALKKAGVDVTFQVVQGGGHGFNPAQSQKLMPIVTAFLDKHLKTPPASQPAE